MNELFRQGKLTNEGIFKVKEILTDPSYRKIFAQILCKETNDMSRESKIGVIMQIKKMLNSGISYTVECP